MKVLFIANHYQPGTAYTHRLDKLREALTARGFETEMLNMRAERFPRPIFVQPLNVPALAKRLSGIDFLHGGEEATFAATWLGPRIGARVIHDVHGDVIGEALQRHEIERSPYSYYWLSQARLINGRCFRKSDFSLVVSEPARSWIHEEKGVQPDTVELVRNGVDMQRFSPRPLPGGSDFIVGYAGGFQHWQGIDNLIEAFTHISDPRIRLRLIGFTPDLADFAASVRAKLGERVDLVDRLPQAELPDALAACHTLAIPRSRHQAVSTAFPTKYGEYCALSRPVIVTDVDETGPLTRQHRCGLVAEPDPVSLAARISEAAGLSSGELSEMGARGRALAESEFAWDVIGDRYAAALHRWSGA